MSDTPRTDELVTELEGLHSGAQADDLEDLCRTLERELSLAVAKVGEMERIITTHNKDCVDRCDSRFASVGSEGDYCRHIRAIGRWCSDCPKYEQIDDAALKQSDQQGEK